VNAAFFQKMIDEEYDAKHHRYESTYSKKVQGRSPNDRIGDLL
jgi:hypothetical protein